MAICSPSSSRRQSLVLVESSDVALRTRLARLVGRADAVALVLLEEPDSVPAMLQRYADFIDLAIVDERYSQPGPSRSIEVLQQVKPELPVVLLHEPLAEPNISGDTPIILQDASDLAALERLLAATIGPIGRKSS